MGAKVLPMAKLTQQSCLWELFVCVEFCAVVKQNGNSAAYDKIGPKVLFGGLKKGGLHV